MEIDVKKKNKNDRLSFKTLASYSTGVIGLMGIMQLTMMYITFYYTDVLGIGAAAAGTLLLVARIWDGVNDPIMGYIVDNTNTKYGKSTPYIIGGAIPLAIFGALAFTVPNISDTGKLVWAYVTYIGFGMSFTAVAISYLSLFSRLTSNPNERIRLSICLQVFTYVASIVITAVAIPVVNNLGKGNMAKGFSSLGIIVGIFTIIMLFIAGFNLKEANVSSDTKKQNKISIKKSLTTIISNKPFLILTLISLINGTALGIIYGSTYYYVVYYLKKPDLASIIMPISLVCSVIGTFLAPLIAKKLGKYRTMLYGFIIAIGCLIIRLFLKDVYLPSFLVIYIIQSLGASFLGVFLAPMITDSIDYCEWKTGSRIEGITFSAFTLQQKVGVGLGAAILGFILDWFGYVPQVSVQSIEALNGLFIAQVVTPLIGNVIMFVLFLFYKLDDKKMSIIMSELQIRRENNTN